MNKILRSVLFVGLVLFLFCKINTLNTNDDTVMVSIKDLRIKNDMQQWEEKKDTYVEYDIKGLYGLIDGGATIYEGHGMKDGIYQELHKKDERFVSIYAFDFEKANNADAIFKEIVDLEMTNTITIDDYETDVAIGSTALGGGCVYAQFNYFYLWLNFTGYENPNDIADDAKKFLKLYEEKIGG